MEIGKYTLLQHVVTRLIPLDRPIVVATSERVVDDQIASHSQDLGVSVYRGSTGDVAKRSVQAAESLGGDWFVRSNADSPFPDPDLILSAGRHQRPDVDLVTNIPGRTFPYGVSVEVVRVARLREQLDSLTASEREHVTSVFYRDSALYRVARITSRRPELKAARLTVDTEADLKEIRRLVDSLDDSTSASWTEIAERLLKLRKAPC